MTRSIVFALLLTAVVLLSAQQNQSRPAYEVKTLFPHETSPGFYRQTEPNELESLAEQGWELVSVMPYVYRNEERGSGNPKAVVTQTYPAYFFKRAKVR